MMFPGWRDEDGDVTVDTVAPGGAYSGMRSVQCEYPSTTCSAHPAALGANAHAADRTPSAQPGGRFSLPSIRGRNRAKPLQLGRKPLGHNKTPPGVLPGGTPANAPKSQQRRQITVTVFVPNRDRNRDSLGAS